MDANQMYVNNIGIAIMIGLKVPCKLNAEVYIYLICALKT